MTLDEIIEEYEKLSNANKVDILMGAIDNMQQYNGRSVDVCIALAMGYDASDYGGVWTKRTLTKPPPTMTTAEKNRVIAEYMGYTALDLRRYSDFNKDWNALMPVWSKLRGELTITKELYKVRYNIENAILSCDITTAFNLMVEAILLIKK